MAYEPIVQRFIDLIKAKYEPWILIENRRRHLIIVVIPHILGYSDLREYIIDPSTQTAEYKLGYLVTLEELNHKIMFYKKHKNTIYLIDKQPQ